MAEECCCVITAINYVKGEHFDSSTNNQLDNAVKKLAYVAFSLTGLEKAHPENGISTQLRALFTEALHGFVEISSHMNDQGKTTDTIRMISKVLKIIRLENIAEQIKASKPSRSSSLITMEMVGSVVALLRCFNVVLHILDVKRPVLVKKLRYLGVFLSLTANQCNGHERMKDLFAHAEDVAYTTLHLCFLGLAYSMEKEDDLQGHRVLDCEFSKLLERLSPFRPELRQLYLSLLIESKSSQLETTMSADFMSESVNAIKEDLEELLSRDGGLKVTFDDRIPWLQKGLPYLSTFLHDIVFKRIPLEEFNSLQSHIEALVIEAAIVIYSSCYDEEGMKTTEIDHELFLLQLKFNHVKVELHLIKLLNCEATIIAPLKYLIDCVREELILLRAFLMDSSEQCKEQTKNNDFLTLIRSVTNQAWSVIKTLSHESEQEDMAREINRLHFQLLLKFKFIKAVIRQMCPNISTSSSLDHPTIDLLSCLPINFDVIDSYFSMLRSSKTQSLHSPKMDEVLMGFHEYILSNLLLKDESYLIFTVANEVKKYYYGLLLLVTYLVDPPVQSIECMKPNDFLTRVGTFAIEAESAICLIYEEGLDSNKSRKINLVLRFLTIAFELMKSEGSLMVLLQQKTTLKVEILDLIESVQEELIFLRAFLMDVLTQHTELNELHDLLVRAEATAHKLGQISGFCYGSFVDGSSTQQIRLSLSDPLQEIESVKVEFRKVFFQLMDATPCNMTDGEGLVNFLLNRQDRLLNYGDCSISFLKNQMLVVKAKSEYLGSFLADIVHYRDMHQELKDLVRRVQDMNYVCFFHIKGYRPVWCYMLYLSDVKQLLKYVEADVKMICLKVPHSLGYSFPKTNGLGFLNCFLGKLEEMLRSKLDSVIDLKHQIESVKEGLLCLRSLINHFAESLDEHDEVHGLVTSVTEMAYQAEYVIDSCLACSHPLWYKILWISEVVENIKLKNKVVSETCERKKIDVTVHKVANTRASHAPFLSASTPRTNEEMEGFQEAMDKIKKQLLGGSSHLDIISIVGMAGIGKTTLAEKIYNDLIATPHFDVHAKCRVTQVYSWKELLLTILNYVLQPADRTEKEEGELANELRQVLLTKRFLILIDDVWDETAWNYLYMCFRDAHSGSRIILTTRLTDIANYAKCESNPHHLRLFRDDESWTLLKEEVFQGDICPPELVNVGFRIAKSCGGLPLFVVLVAGVLKEKKKKEDLWKEVEESLGSHNSGSLEESMSLIGFSYKNLPHHLKPCFLYLGGFLKGKDIHVSKLIRLWQAEGFVQANKGKSIEDVAHDFFGDLISRNIVMAMERRPDSKVKRCRIHDLLHNFCLEKAKQENFLNQINRGMDMLPEKPEDYRLFIHSYQDEIDLWRPCRSNVRSLQFKVVDPDNLLWPRDISFIFESFKLVKVLDLESFNVGGTFPSEIQSLIHLRYFAVQTDANSIPSFIAKLRNLETFVVRGLGGEVILPCSLLRMVKLRHIVVKRRASFSLHENMDESSLSNSQLNDLETFSTPRLSYGENAETILAKMPNLRKLSCIFLGTFSYSEKSKGRCVLFPRLEFLSHLESVKLVSNSFPAKLPHEFNFPSNLRELTLSKFRLPWSEISIIGELPNLEILKLLFRAFEGNQWEVKDSDFPELKYLKLDNINFSQWSISEDAFPKLEILVLTKCERLEEIPSHFGDAISLNSIEVNRCGWSVANSAQEIQTTQHEDMANDAFTVTIQPPDWATRSSP